MELGESHLLTHTYYSLQTWGIMLTFHIVLKKNVSMGMRKKIQKYNSNKSK